MKAKKKGLSTTTNSAEVPQLVMFVKMMAMMDMPIGHETYNEALTKHPEHFPEEVEYRRIYATIPKEVHDDYYAEIGSPWDKGAENEFEDIIGKHPHPELRGKGIIWRVTVGDVEYYNEMQDCDAYDRKFFKQRENKERKIWEKHYSKYGLKK